MTYHRDAIATVVLCCGSFVGGVMFAAWRQLQREKLAAWIRKTRRI